MKTGVKNHKRSFVVDFLSGAPVFVPSRASGGQFDDVITEALQSGVAPIRNVPITHNSCLKRRPFPGVWPPRSHLSSFGQRSVSQGDSFDSTSPAFCSTFLSWSSPSASFYWPSSLLFRPLHKWSSLSGVTRYHLFRSSSVFCLSKRNNGYETNDREIPFF